MGNLLVLMGARTGRDGIGGASVLASAELDEDDASKRPSVQIGDPFEEKKLLECCLELLERGTLRSLQDLGAAGLSSSSSEMASKGEVGLDLDVSRVPLREDDMEPFEIMVSESQERMLCVVEPGRLAELEEVCGRWEVRATAIGEVTDTRRLRVLDGEEVVGDMPVGALVDDCPLYDLEPERPAQQMYPAPERQLGSDDARESLLALMASPNLASRRPLFEQYDSIVGSRTVRRPEQADAAVLQLAPDGGSGRHRRVHRRQRAPRGVRSLHRHRGGGAGVRLQPGLRRGGAAGAHQLPELRQPREATRGVAARALGGRHGGRAAGAGGARGGRQRVPLQRVRRRPDLSRRRWWAWSASCPTWSARHRSRFAEEGHAVAVCGELQPHLPGGELAKLRGQELPTELPAVDVAKVRAAQEAVRDAVRAGELASAHDIAGGGLLVAVAECCLAGGIGATLDLATGDPLLHLFGEGPGGFVVSGPREVLERLAQRTPLDVVGTVGGDELAVTAAGEQLSVSLAELSERVAALEGAFA